MTPLEIGLVVVAAVMVAWHAVLQWWPERPARVAHDPLAPTSFAGVVDPLSQYPEDQRAAWSYHGEGHLLPEAAASMRGYFGVMPNPQPPKQGDVVTLVGISGKRDGRYLVTYVGSPTVHEDGQVLWPSMGLQWVGPVE